MVELWVSARRFGVAGALATLVHAGVFLILVYGVSLAPPVSTVVAFLCAVVFSYRVHHAWTFEASGNHRVFFWRFALISGLGAALNFGIMWVATHVLAWSPLAGLAAVIVMVAPSTFLASRYWGFQ